MRSSRHFIPVILIIILVLNIFTPGCNNNTNPELVIELDENASSGLGGRIKIELMPEWSPNSVYFIIWLVQNGYYDKLPCFRTVQDQMIAFGDAWNRKKIDKVIEGEFPLNDKKGAGVAFKKGTVGMWYDGEDYDSCYGSFFIMLSENAPEDFSDRYAPVGMVTEGIELCVAIGMIKSSEVMHYEPYETVRFKSVNVILHGKTYPMPVTMKRTDYPGR